MPQTPICCSYTGSDTALVWHSAEQCFQEVKGWLKRTSAHHLIQPHSWSRAVAADKLSHSFVQLCAEGPTDGAPPATLMPCYSAAPSCKEFSPNVQSELPKVATWGCKVKIKANISGYFSQIHFLLLHTLVCTHYTHLLKTSRHHFTQQESQTLPRFPIPVPAQPEHCTDELQRKPSRHPPHSTHRITRAKSLWDRGRAFPNRNKHTRRSPRFLIWVKNLTQKAILVASSTFRCKGTEWSQTEHFPALWEIT